MTKMENLEQLVERVAQNYSEIVSERNRMKSELASKNEEIERVRRECTQQIDELKSEYEANVNDNSQIDARLDALYSRLESLLESRVSEVLTGV